MYIPTSARGLPKLRGGARASRARVFILYKEVLRHSSGCGDIVYDEKTYRMEFGFGFSTI